MFARVALGGSSLLPTSVPFTPPHPIPCRKFVFLLLSLLALLLALALAALGYLPPQATSALHQVPGAEAVLRSIREKVAPLLGAGKDEL